MSEYHLNLIAPTPDRMGEQEARDYAPQWGSLMRDGDPGAVMYGNPADPADAAAMLAYTESDLLPGARAKYGLATENTQARADDVADLERLAAYLRTVTAESDWSKASPLERGFIECLFFQAPEDPAGEDGDIHREGAVSELAPDAWQAVRSICATFRSAAGNDLTEAVALPDYSEEQAGRDLCFTLLGAGVGFTDRRQLEGRDVWEAMGSPRVNEPGWQQWEAERENSLAYRLERAAKRCGHCEGLYRGDSGALHIWAESMPAAAA